MTLAIERPVQLCLFDYSELDSKTRNRVKKADETVKTNIYKAYKHYQEACKALKEIEENLTEDQFKRYCVDLGISNSKASKMLKVAVIPPLPERDFNITAIDWLAGQPEEKQEIIISALTTEYSQEADENKRISKEMLKSIDQRITEDQQKALKSLRVGDYVKVGDKTGKIITINKETCFIDFLDGINPKSHPFDKIQSVLCPQWQETDINLVGESVELYRGWSISTETQVTIDNTKTAYFFSLEGLEIADQDWAILQCFKKIDRIEKAHRRPDTLKFWSPDTKELGSFVEEYQGNEILLIKDENGLITGCQIRLGEDDYSTLKIGEWGLDLADWPQVQKDPNWWVLQAKQCDFSEDEDEINLEVKEINEPHPDYTSGKWKPEDWVEAYGEIGKIKSLHPHGAIVIFADKNELISYDLLQKHSRPDPIPESQINLIPVGIINRVKEVLGDFTTIKSLSEDWGKQGENLLVIPPHEQTVDFLKKIETSYNECALYEAIAIFPFDINSILAIDSGNICYLSSPIDDTYYLVWYLGIYPDTFAKFFEDLGTIWDKH